MRKSLKLSNFFSALCAQEEPFSRRAPISRCVLVLLANTASTSTPFYLWSFCYSLDILEGLYRNPEQEIAAGRTSWVKEERKERKKRKEG